VRQGRGHWPPRAPCFAPRLGEYLARLEQEPLPSLLARPAALARALRRASELLELEVECLDVPATWILHSAGWPAAVGERGIELGAAPSTLPSPAEIVKSGPLAVVREALRALPPANAAPATLLALPSPARLAEAARDEGYWRACLQTLVRSVGELEVLAAVMLDGDDGVAALHGVLAHYQLAAVCIRRPGDARPLPAGAIVARAWPLEMLAGAAPDESALLITTDGAVSPEVAPEDLLRASRRE
jgi:hypothetical protein